MTAGAEQAAEAAIGRYRLRSRLGAGGMAEVFVATHEGAAGFERPVCIKRILPHLARDPEFRDLFVREAKLAGRLSHAAIVQVFDCIEDGETLAIVMELVAGMDLRRLSRALARRGEVLPEGVVAHLGGQLLGALRFAHAQQVIHRDVSPHNVLVSCEGEVKLADFGVAKALQTQASRSGEIKGKLAYMSPEQARGEPVDQRTDLYATGLVLFELLEGARFFPQDNAAELVAAVTNARQPRLGSTHPALARLVERLLAPRVEDRYQSAVEALRDLPSWELTGPLGALELGSIVDEILAEEREPPTEEARLVPSGVLRGGDPDGTELLPGGTAVVEAGPRPRAERAVVPLPASAPTITRSGDLQRELEVAPTAEASSGPELVPEAPARVEEAPTAIRSPEVVAPVVPPATASLEEDARGGRLGAARTIFVAIGVFAVLGAAAAIGYRLVAPPRPEPSGPAAGPGPADRLPEPAVEPLSTRELPPAGPAAVGPEPARRADAAPQAEPEPVPSPVGPSGIARQDSRRTPAAQGRPAPPAGAEAATRDAGVGGVEPPEPRQGSRRPRRPPEDESPASVFDVNPFSRAP